MSSELRALLLALLGACAGCADLERGKPLPDAAAPDTAGPGGAGGQAGTETGPAGRSFATHVHPLLVDGCRSCHSSNGQASNTALLLTSDAGRDLAGVARFVNQDSPAASRLLSKGAGVSHGGGAIFAAGSPEYQTILEWISQGSAP